MTAGFQAYTSTGLLQIDGLSPNMTLTYKTSVTTAPGQMLDVWQYAGDTGPTAPVATVTFSANSPLVAINSPSTPATVISTTNNGNGTWTVQIWSLSATTLTLYVFDQLPFVSQPSGAAYGFQVFNASGTLIYDARQPPVSILGFESGNILNASPTTFYQQLNWPGNSSQSFATGVSKVATGAMLNASGIDENVYYALSGWQHSGGTAVMNFCNVNVNDQYPPNYFVGFGAVMSWSALLIDVSYL